MGLAVVLVDEPGFLYVVVDSDLVVPRCDAPVLGSCQLFGPLTLPENPLPIQNWYVLSPKDRAWAHAALLVGAVAVVVLPVADSRGARVDEIIGIVAVRSVVAVVVFVVSILCDGFAHQRSSIVWCDLALNVLPW